MLYERAVAELPGSYKLWSYYLRERRAHLRSLPNHMPTSRAHRSLSLCFERALVTLHKVCSQLNAQHAHMLEHNTLADTLSSPPRLSAYPLVCISTSRLLLMSVHLIAVHLTLVHSPVHTHTHTHTHTPVRTYRCRAFGKSTWSICARHPI
jgi:hypothetical protein